MGALFSSAAAPPPAKEGLIYGDIRHRIQTFDLLLFRGYDPVSDAIAAVERCFVGYNEYTHVGIAVRGGDLPGTHRGALYVWEATMSGPLGDGVMNIDGEAFLGVQLRDLDDVVEAYDAHPDTRLAWAPLRRDARDRIAEYEAEQLELARIRRRARASILANHPVRMSEIDERMFPAGPGAGAGAAVGADAGVGAGAGAGAGAGIGAGAGGVDEAIEVVGLTPGASALAALFKQLNGRRYDTACCALAGAAGAICRPLRAIERCVFPATKDWLFCSELACRVYQAVGLIGADVESMDVIPVDFVPRALSRADAEAGAVADIMSSVGSASSMGAGNTSARVSAGAGSANAGTSSASAGAGSANVGAGSANADASAASDIEHHDGNISDSSVASLRDSTPGGTYDADRRVPAIVLTPIRFTAYPPPTAGGV